MAVRVSPELRLAVFAPEVRLVAELRLPKALAVMAAIHRPAAEAEGRAAGTTQWTAILTLVEKAPRDADTLRKNPLGIYVDAIDWSRELEPQVQSSASPAVAAQSGQGATSPAPASAPAAAADGVTVPLSAPLTSKEVLP